MESGCHVLVEKPMALTLEEADAMVAAARKNSVKLCVDHNNLWEPLMMRARQLVEEGKAGKVLHVDVYYYFDIKRMHVHNANNSSKMNWIFNLPGGLLFDLLPHPVSILLHFLKGPVKIWAVAKHNGILADGLPDELRALFSTAHATGNLSVSMGIKPDCITITIYGTEMTIHVNLSNMTLITRKNKAIPKKILRAVDNIDQAVQLLSCTFINGLKVLMGMMPTPDDVGAVIINFYKSIENGALPPVTGEEGRAVVEATQQIAEQIA
jgi:predicted dehydrogenase